MQTLNKNYLWLYNVPFPKKNRKNEYEKYEKVVALFL